MNQFFGLRKIAPLVASYVPPATALKVAKDWKHSYRIFTLAGMGFTPQGQIEIERTTRPGGRFKLQIQITRNAISGFNQYTLAELDGLDNPLSSPASWSVTTKIAKAIDAPGYLYSEMTKTARVDSKKITFRVGNRQHARPMEQPFTCKYNLLDAVQRMPRQPEPLHFTCLDEFDEAGSNHTLRYRQSASIQMKDAKHILHQFQQTGAGLIPASYWTDEQGRLLFFISGIEVFVLEEENGIRIPYRKDRTIFQEATQLVKQNGGQP